MQPAALRRARPVGSDRAERPRYPGHRSRERVRASAGHRWISLGMGDNASGDLSDGGDNVQFVPCESIGPGRGIIQIAQGTSTGSHCSPTAPSKTGDTTPTASLAMAPPLSDSLTPPGARRRAAAGSQMAEQPAGAQFLAVPRRLALECPPGSRVITRYSKERLECRNPTVHLEAAAPGCFPSVGRPSRRGLYAPIHRGGSESTIFIVSMLMVTMRASRSTM